MGKIPMIVSEQDKVRKSNKSLIVPQKDNCIKNNNFSYQSSSIVHSAAFKCPISKMGSAQMFDHQERKEGFGRRGYGIRGTFSFRGRGFNSSRGTYAREYHTSERDLSNGRGNCRGRGGRNSFHGRSGYRGRGGRELSLSGSDCRGQGGRELSLSDSDYRGQVGRELSFSRSDYRDRGGRDLYHGRNDYRGRGGRGDFKGRCGTDFPTGRSDYRGRGGRELRGRGGRELRARGRISQNNFDAKQYAEKCKAENKTPELGFKGVDLKMIFGYAAVKGDS